MRLLPFLCSLGATLLLALTAQATPYLSEQPQLTPAQRAAQYYATAQAGTGAQSEVPLVWTWPTFNDPTSNLFLDVAELPEPASADNPVTLDIMVVWFDSLNEFFLEWRDFFGYPDTVTSVEQALDIVVAHSNQVMADSLTYVTLRVVHIEPKIDFTWRHVDDEGNESTPFFQFGNPTDNMYDGKLDRLHTVQRQYGADLVILLTHIGSGGTAWLFNPSRDLRPVTHPWAKGARAWIFSALDSVSLNSPYHPYPWMEWINQRSWEHPRPSYTFVHEIGHALGCGHSWEQETQSGPGTFTISSGHRWLSGETFRNALDLPDGEDVIYWSPLHFGTVMCYPQDRYPYDGPAVRSLETYTQRRGYFSNPDVIDWYTGLPTGHPEKADNARTIRHVAPVVANNQPTISAWWGHQTLDDGWVWVPWMQQALYPRTPGRHVTVIWPKITWWPSWDWSTTPPTGNTGLYPYEHTDWHFHPTLGSFWTARTATEDNLWMFFPDMGWLYTTSESYPAMYAMDRDGWVWYRIGTSNPRQFVDLTTEEVLEW